jgi:multidrug efflux pump subunit AcrB
VQKHEGNNIVEFGKNFDDSYTNKKRSSSLVEFTIITNQPEIVKPQCNPFLQEYLIAIIAVINVFL